MRIAVVGAGATGHQHILRTMNEPEARLAAIVDPSEGQAMRTLETTLAVKEAAATGRTVQLA